jgi:hypothetical protein
MSKAGIAKERSRHGYLFWLPAVLGWLYGNSHRHTNGGSTVSLPRDWSHERYHLLYVERRATHGIGGSKLLVCSSLDNIVAPRHHTVGDTHNQHHDRCRKAAICQEYAGGREATGLAIAGQPVHDKLIRWLFSRRLSEPRQ